MSDFPRDGWDRRTVSLRIGLWLSRNARRLLALGGVLTALLILPLLLIGDAGQASVDTGGEVFELRDTIQERFSTPVHFVPFMVEARDGDMLTQEALYELLRNERKLLELDASGGLAVGNLPKQPYLHETHDPDLDISFIGVRSIANAADAVLRNDPTLDTSLQQATDPQVKMAVHRLLASPVGSVFRDSLSIHTTHGPAQIRGERIERWEAPALVMTVFADNEKLGGGEFAASLGASEGILTKEKFNRRVQEVLRGDQRHYRMWGMAIDANLEGEDEGETAGVFILFTVVAAVAVVGLTLRSYWAVVLTGIGLGVLMIWLKGISNLVGLKGGLIIELIVPIAMISLGVDFAIHAVRRYQEERRGGLAPGRALVVGMGGVLGALILALLSDSVAFLSNASSGVQGIIHFALAAAIATGASFTVLGILVPLGLMEIEKLEPPGFDPNGGRRKLLRVLSGLGAAALSGTAVIFLVAVSKPAGVVVLIAAAVLYVLIPVIRMRRARRGETSSAEHISRRDEAQDRARSIFDRVSVLTEILATAPRYRWIVLPATAVITGVATVFALRLQATFDVKDFFSSDSDMVVGLDKLDEHIGNRGGEPADVYIEGDLSDPAVLSALEASVRAMQDNPYLARDTDGAVSVSGPRLSALVASAMKSEAARKAIAATAPGTVLRDTDADGLPDSRDGIRAVLEYAMEEGVPAEDGTTRYTASDVRTVLSLGPDDAARDAHTFSVFLPGTREQSTIPKARASLEEDLGALKRVSPVRRAGLAGAPFVRQAQLEATTSSLQRSIFIAAAATLTLLLVTMRSFRYALVTVIPVALVVAWLYAIMHVSGFALNFVTATIGAVSIGVGIDYSIHMTQRFREELRRCGARMTALRQAIRGTGVALMASALSSIVGFAIMGFAPMPLFSTYGILTAIMIFLALAASLIVLPSLLVLVTPASTKTAAGEGGTLTTGAEPGARRDA